MDKKYIFTLGLALGMGVTPLLKKVDTREIRPVQQQNMKFYIKLWVLTAPV